jgi:hypothetical protein
MELFLIRTRSRLIILTPTTVIIALRATAAKRTMAWGKIILADTSHTETVCLVTYVK